MRLDDERESSNVEDRRGESGRGVGIPGGKLGIGGIVLVLVVSYFTGISPNTLLGMVPNTGTQQATPMSAPPANDEKTVFVSKILADTEDTWQGVFQAAGKTYPAPKLVLFTGSTPTACGNGSAAMGPFYCGADQKVYIDLAFYQELKDRYHAPGEFAEAYVIAHEVGHHIQHLLGTSDQVQQAQQKAANSAVANALSVRLELQADCYAGIWGYHADQTEHRIEPGEVEQALTAAAAIGDDQLQKQSQGYAVPDTFTHGTSAQRVKWFTRGMETGDLAQCNTFAAKDL
ncbi:MAG: hypothetical protein HOP20_03805 [Sulfuriferula sp.]|nr:hypothetical protein [Sulfuriferula sp.]